MGATTPRGYPRKGSSHFQRAYPCAQQYEARDYSCGAHWFLFSPCYPALKGGAMHLMRIRAGSQIVPGAEAPELVWFTHKCVSIAPHITSTHQQSPTRFAGRQKGATIPADTHPKAAHISSVRVRVPDNLKPDTSRAGHTGSCSAPFTRLEEAV